MCTLPCARCVVQGAMGILTGGALPRDVAYSHGVIFAMAPFLGVRLRAAEPRSPLPDANVVSVGVHFTSRPLHAAGAGRGHATSRLPHVVARLTLFAVAPVRRATGDVCRGARGWHGKVETHDRANAELRFAADARRL